MIEKNHDEGVEMETPIIIEAPVGAEYLRQFMDTLPLGIVNKKETGCGATSLMLENNENVIICCPTIQLIKSKLSQYPNRDCLYHLFGVMKGVSEKDIETYVERCRGRQPVKIMTTYDSFPKVAGTIGDVLKDFKIVVDEYQELLDARVYRWKSIQNLLYGLREYENVTYLSATPIPYKYLPNELKRLSYYEINWPNRTRVKPYRVQTDSPFSWIVEMIRMHQEGIRMKIEGYEVEELFIFVNTVKGANKIINDAGLSPDEVKIVCAKGVINKLKLGKEYKIQDISDENKTFNFYTKTAFYGTDIYSKSGLAVIVSDGYVKSTLLDITSDIQQIAGRIRTEENPFKNIILHVHSPKGKLLSHEEFEVKLAERIMKAKNDIDAFNKLVGSGLESSIIEKQKVNEPEAVSYYDPDSHSIKIDELKIAHMRHKFETIDSVYTGGVSIEKAYEMAGYNIEEAETWIQNVGKRMNRPKSKTLFHEYSLTYSEEREKSSIGKTELAKEIEQRYPLIHQAYFLLGDIRLKQLGYDEEKVRKWVYFKMSETQVVLKRELSNFFFLGKRYTNKNAKDIVGQIFEKLRIELTPSTKFLNSYFGVKKVKICFPDSYKRIDGIEITRGIE